CSTFLSSWGDYW
nr:immunoglobulin heavy chain junction region [Macaca mulatta]MOV87929.1 immunoglobulin heavy chain junction region [Macaca mulatta]MOV89318.1 immunoglobulin heavy chain junction region [Macaca mulatta]MOV89772.1 immunoglobulin heavy chain junction region [Macaca mulatta]